MSKKISLEKSISIVSRIETNLAKKPYNGVIWDANKGIVLPKGKTLARRLIYYALQLPCKEETLLKDYKEFLGVKNANSRVTLPTRVV